MNLKNFYKTELNKKLYKAYIDGDEDKILKYLKMGADVTEDVCFQREDGTFHNDKINSRFDWNVSLFEVILEKVDCNMLGLMSLVNYEINLKNVYCRLSSDGSKNGDLLKIALDYFTSNFTMNRILLHSYLDDVCDSTLFILFLLDHFDVKNTTASLHDCFDMCGNLLEECADALIEYDVNLYYLNRGSIPIFRIIDNGNDYLFEKLIDRGYDVFHDIHKDNSVLLKICECNKGNMLKKILPLYIESEKFSDIESCVKKSFLSGDVETLEIFLKNGINIEGYKIDGKSFFKYLNLVVQENNCLNNEKNFLKYGSYALESDDEIFKNYKELLSFFIKFTCIDYINESISHNQLFSIIDDCDLLALYSLICKGNLFFDKNGVLELSLCNEDPIVLSDNIINSLANNGMNLLMYAVINQNIELIKILLQTNINLNIRSFNKMSVVDYACLTKNDEIINLINEHVCFKTEDSLIENEKFFKILEVIDEISFDPKINIK